MALQLNLPRADDHTHGDPGPSGPAPGASGSEPTGGVDRAGVVDRGWPEVQSLGAGALLEALPGGFWLRPTDGDTEAGLDGQRRWLADRLAVDAGEITVVLGRPGAAPFPLAGLAAFWRRLPVPDRPRARLVRYGPLDVPDDAWGQAAADLLGGPVIVHTGLTVTTPDGPATLTIGPDGELGWPPLAVELGYLPRSADGPARPPALLRHRSPIDGLPEIAPGTYRYDPGTVLEVIRAGLWLRPEPAGATHVRAVASDPGHAVFYFGDGTPASAAELAAHAESASRRLAPDLRAVYHPQPAPAHTPAGGTVAVPPQTAPVRPPHRAATSVEAEDAGPADLASNAPPVIRLESGPSARSVIGSLGGAPAAPLATGAVAAATDGNPPRATDSGGLSLPDGRAGVPTEGRQGSSGDESGPSLEDGRGAPPGDSTAPSLVDGQGLSHGGGSRPVLVDGRGTSFGRQGNSAADHHRTGAVVDAVVDAVVAQGVPEAAAAAMVPARGVGSEREWLRANLGPQHDATAGGVSRMLAHVPGVLASSPDQPADALTDLVATRLYLTDQLGQLDDAIRAARVGPHVPLARCAASGLRLLPSYRGPVAMRVSLSSAQRRWYDGRRVITEWGFTRAGAAEAADTSGGHGEPVPGTRRPGDTDILIWSLTGRRTALLNPARPHQVVFAPGTSFKVLRTGTEILLRELSSVDVGPRGEVDLGVVPLDELALAGLTRTVAAGVPGPPPADPPGLLPAKLTDAARAEGVAA